MYRVEKIVLGELGRHLSFALNFKEQALRELGLSVAGRATAHTWCSCDADGPFHKDQSDSLCG